MANDSPSPGPETPGGTESADRVADVLLLFGRSDSPLGVTRIARDLSLSKAVVHRILRSLVSRSLLHETPSGSAYILGPAAMALSSRAFSQVDVRGVALPILRQLRDDTGETTTLSVLIGHQRIYLDQFESPQEIKMVVEIGPRYPLHSGASSRVILAHLPEAYVDEAIDQLRELRPDLDAEAYRHDLEVIRERGYAVSQNERNTGAYSIGAPFFDAAGNVMGSISSSGPVYRYASDTHQADIELVVAAAHAITRRLRG